MTLAPEAEAEQIRPTASFALVALGPDTIQRIRDDVATRTKRK